MEESLVRYNKLSEKVFIEVMAETLTENDENHKHHVKLIARALFDELIGFEENGLLEKLKAPEVEKKIGKSEREDLINFLNGFFARQIDDIVMKEKSGTKFGKIRYSWKRFLLLARFFILTGDRRMAAECLWGIAAIELKTFAEDKCKIELNSHNSLYKFCGALGQPELMNDFMICSNVHSNGFYEDIMTLETLQSTMEIVERFVKNLQEYSISMSEGKKRYLQGLNFK